VAIGDHHPPRRQGAFEVSPANPRGGDVWGARSAVERVRDTGASAVLVMHDLWHMKRFAGTFPDLPAGVRRVLYVPLDGELVEPEADGLIRPLELFDEVVAYTPLARRQLAQAVERLTSPPRVSDLPHGLERERFAAAAELVAADFDPAARAASRRAVFGAAAARWRDPFVVLNPSRPASRKRIDLTLEAFALFARDKPPDVRLCLHQAIRGDRELADREARVAALGIEHRLLRDPFGEGVVDDAALQRLYGACDVGLTTTMGEGWGLVAFEHAAAGGAQVMPRHSACGELWHGAAAFVEPERAYVPAFSPFRMAEVTAEAAAAALDRLYSDRTHLRTVSRACWERSRDPALDWLAIGEAWRRLFAPGATPRSGDGRD
jgi:D-inositol-3-phosphate glycosyltransferase